MFVEQYGTPKDNQLPTAFSVKQLSCAMLASNVMPQTRPLPINVPTEPHLTSVLVNFDAAGNSSIGLSMAGGVVLNVNGLPSGTNFQAIFRFHSEQPVADVVRFIATVDVVVPGQVPALVANSGDLTGAAPAGVSLAATPTFDNITIRSVSTLG